MSLLHPAYRNSFDKDVKRLKKRGLDLAKLGKLIDLLVSQKPLPVKYKDHKLSGEWRHHRECHVVPDWLLIYQIRKSEKIIVFERTGTHADLFE